MATEAGGRRQPASGATPWAKGDVKTVKALFERKDTMNRSYSLRVDDWLKLRQQAREAGLEPVFVVAMNGSEPPVELAVVDAKLMYYLLEKGL